MMHLTVICVPERAVPDEAAEVQRAAARPHQVEPRHRGCRGAAAAGAEEGDPSCHGRVRFRQLADRLLPGKYLYKRCLCLPLFVEKTDQLEFHLFFVALAAASEPTSEEQVRWPGGVHDGGGCIRRDWFGASPIDGWHRCHQEINPGWNSQLCM